MLSENLPNVPILILRSESECCSILHTLKGVLVTPTKVWCVMKQTEVQRMASFLSSEHAVVWKCLVPTAFVFLASSQLFFLSLFCNLEQPHLLSSANITSPFHIPEHTLPFFLGPSVVSSQVLHFARAVVATCQPFPSFFSGSVHSIDISVFLFSEFLLCFRLMPPSTTSIKF